MPKEELKNQYKEHDVRLVQEFGPLKNDSEPLEDKYFITPEKTEAVAKIFEQGVNSFFENHGLSWKK